MAGMFSNAEADMVVGLATKEAKQAIEETTCSVNR